MSNYYGTSEILLLFSSSYRWTLRSKAEPSNIVNMTVKHRALCTLRVCMMCSVDSAFYLMARVRLGCTTDVASFPGSPHARTKNQKERGEPVKFIT